MCFQIDPCSNCPTCKTQWDTLRKVGTIQMNESYFKKSTIKEKMGKSILQVPDTAYWNGTVLVRTETFLVKQFCLKM